MRTASAIFAGSMAALAVLTTPMLAKTSDAQKTDDKSAASPCRAYEQTADGEWKPIPCQEGSEARTQHKPPTGSADETTH
jgi:hypothetical protein